MMSNYKRMGKEPRRTEGLELFPEPTQSHDHNCDEHPLLTVKNTGGQWAGRFICLVEARWARGL